MTAEEGKAYFTDKKPRLLAAEDDPVTGILLKTLFKGFGADIDIVEDGQKAVEMWEDGGYELIIMDVKMPSMDGFDATKLIRDKERCYGSGHIPIVGMTGCSDEEKQQCQISGMDACLSKPIDLDKTIITIANLLGCSHRPV